MFVFYFPYFSIGAFEASSRANGTTFFPYSAKAITSQVLGSTPNHSHWRDNFERGVETLNYFKQVLNSLHPTGYNYPVYMDNFFQYFTSTGTVHKGPKAKRRKTTSGIPAPTQTPSEESEESQPPQGPPASQPAPLYIPSVAPIQQDLYAYDCYYVEISNPKYNTFTKVPQCPPDLTCYCGLSFNTKDELSLHVSSVHKDKVYKCSSCGTQCRNNRATWKHFRSQHLYIHTHHCTIATWKHFRSQHPYIYTHHCTIASCQFGKNKKPYGNDDQCLVLMHMEKKHSLKPPLVCPKCTKTFSSPKYQIPHIQNKHDLAPKIPKQFGCTQCSKTYMTQKALDGHMLVHAGSQEFFVCEFCGKEYNSKTALQKHLKEKHPDGEEEEGILLD